MDEDLGRATISQQLRDAVTASGGVDASAELLLMAAAAIEAMARDWLANRRDSFAFGRRSGLEEAAKVIGAVADKLAQRPEWSASEIIALISEVKP